MATIRPFKGLRYDQEMIGDISKVITPPYDVISEEERERYYQSHPKNVIRLILGKDLPDDNESSNKYTRAAGFFNYWRKEEVLIEETGPAIYVYAQEFTLFNRKYVRKGFISLVKLEEFATGQIYPHEQTLAKPKADRMKLMQATNANLSQVFAFYKDEDAGVSDILTKTSEGAPETDASPEIDFIDVYGIRNKLWIIRDKKVQGELSLLMEQKPLFIADGHHRYETALFYRDLVRSNNGQQESNGDLPCDYVMMMCVSMDDPGLQILPTHRMVKNVENLNPEKFKNSLNEVFVVKDMGQDCQAESLMQELGKNINEHAFLLYIGAGDNKFYMLKLRDEASLNHVFKNEHSEWKSIDTGILHGYILDKLLGMKAENTSKSENAFL